MLNRGDKSYVEKRFSALETERSSFIAHYQELSRFVNPVRGRFLLTDRNRGERRSVQDIINSHAGQAHKICTSGLVSGTMSASRKWFDMGIDDLDLMEYQPVQIWLSQVGEVMNRVYNRSNFYNMAPVMIGELVQFGTGAMTHEDDYQHVARFYTHTAGSYVIAQGDDYRVNTFGRKFEMTCAQMVQKFGLENVSYAVKNAYDRGDYDTWFPVVHLIDPNPDRKGDSPMAGHKRFRSCYIEPGHTGNEKDKFLRRSGYDEFPVYVPRWAVTGEDIYGTDCPTMTALGDTKMLQIQEKEFARSVQAHNAPALQGPSELAGKDIDIMPGGATLWGDGERGRLSPIFQTNPDWNSWLADIARTEVRIDRAHFVDLFQAITSMEGVQPRNQLELSQRNQERLLQLGPVLERLHGEFLDPLNDRTFNQLVRASTGPNGRWLDSAVIPEPPPELAGREVRPRYISSIAIAQRAAGTGPIEQTMAFAGGLLKAGLIRDTGKIDGDQAIDEYARDVGAPPKLIVPDDVVAANRKKAQVQQELAQGAETAATGASAVKDLATAQAASK